MVNPINGQTNAFLEIQKAYQIQKSQLNKFNFEKALKNLHLMYYQYKDKAKIGKKKHLYKKKFSKAFFDTIKEDYNNEIPLEFLKFESKLHSILDQILLTEK